MWASDEQACRAIKKLLDSARLGHLWTESGPTDGALKIIGKGSGCSHGELLMTQAAFDFWNGCGNLELGRMLAVLDNDRLEAICGLAVALGRGNAAIERWIGER